MNVSSVSSAAYTGGAADGAVSRLQAESSSNAKSQRVQQEVTASVINQIQDQQQYAAEALIGMMRNQVNIFA